MDVEALVDDFAIRSFRDQGDEDYISARMACRAGLTGPFLWASQQTIEKYLKCILLLNRVPGGHVRHNLEKGVNAIGTSGKLTLDLTDSTKEFIAFLDRFGTFRYLEVSRIAAGRQIVTLDRAAWELRRYCSMPPALPQIRLTEGKTAPRFRLPGGVLESIIDDAENAAREPLLWQNAFFGGKARRRVRVGGWFKAVNAPLSLNPQILKKILKYVYLPKPLVDGYKAQLKP